MTDQATDTQPDAHQALINEAKSLGIKNPHVCKPETLEKKIAQAKKEPVKSVNKGKTKECSLIINDFGKRYLDSIGFNFDWIGPVAAQYNINKFEYLHKFKAFRAYVDGQHKDWITINDFALLNDQRNLCEILLKHQNVSADRAVFKFHWRA